MPKLAKFVSPRLVSVHPRERLFDRLDTARASPVVWICAMPGAGKTTLVASYVRARRLPTLWYQVDASDADPASFFYGVREAAAQGAKRKALPLLTPEYLADPAGFARRFYRKLFAGMAKPGMWVLDNFQDGPHDSLVHDVAQHAAPELPDDVNIVVISRTDPPAGCARLRANGQLALIGGNELRLTEEETRAILRLHDADDAWDGCALHARTSGWAAGLTLMLRCGDRDALNNVPQRAAPEVVFDYLATEVFERASPELRTLWLRTSHLPRFTPGMARALTGSSQAARLLHELSQQRYFLDRLDGPELAYQYHPLFQEFLRVQVERCYGVSEQQRLVHRSASQLAEHGQDDAALDMYGRLEDWHAASELILKKAAGVFACGLVRRLQGWIESLPRGVVAETPWLLYWVGACTTQAGNVEDGRRCLEDAYAGFVKANDIAAQALTAAAIIDTYFLDWNNFPELDRWIDVLLALPRDVPPLPSAAAAMRVHASLLQAFLHRRPQDVLARACAEQAWQLRHAEAGITEKLMAAAPLLFHAVCFGSQERARAAVAEFEGLAAGHGAPAMQLIAWSWPSTFYYGSTLQLEQARRASAQAQAIAEANGLFFAIDFLRLASLWGRLPDDLSSAETVLAEVSRSVGRCGPNDQALFHFMSAWLALLQERPRLALDHGETALSIARALGSMMPLLCSLHVCAAACADCGDGTRALELAREASESLASLETGMICFTGLLVQADIEGRVSPSQASQATLRKALAVGRAGGYRTTIFWVPRMASRVCAAALEAGIETEYVDMLIRARHVRAPGPHVAVWPWPVRIRVLGPCSVMIDGASLVFERKAQRKPLELLGAVASAGGQGVDAAAVTAWLWPDLEGDTARNAFAQALHRLRKLLRHEDAVTLHGGRLQIDPAVAWCDTTAFDSVCREIDRTPPPDEDRLAALARRLHELYRGSLLQDEQAAWVMEPRERMHSRFLRAATALAQLLQKAGHVSEVIVLCRRAIEVAPLAEAFHCDLIAAYKAEGRIAEALDAYRRCREILSRTLGIAPGPQAQALYRSLLA